MHTIVWCAVTYVLIPMLLLLFSVVFSFLYFDSSLFFCMFVPESKYWNGNKKNWTQKNGCSFCYCVSIYRLYHMSFRIHKQFTIHTKGAWFTTYLSQFTGTTVTIAMLVRIKEIDYPTIIIVPSSIHIEKEWKNGWSTSSQPLLTYLFKHRHTYTQI